MVAILSEMNDVDFDAAWEKRVDVEIDAGLQVPFIDAVKFDPVKTRLRQVGRFGRR